MTVGGFVGGSEGQLDNGLRIFSARKPLKLDVSTPYPSGIVSTYRPVPGGIS